jgi:lipopolysaccharide transport system permease protein
LSNLNSANLKLIFELSKRDFKIRYLGSLLGIYWNVLHPVVLIAIYTLIFSKVMGARLGHSSDNWSYSLYLCAALLPWNAFSETFNRSVVVLVDNAGFLKKMVFPTYILFLSTLLTSLINFAITLTVYLVVLLSLGRLHLEFLPVYLVFALGFNFLGMFLGMGIGCLNVFLRDFQQLTAIIFQLWFWFTPIVYLTDHLPGIAQKLLWFNPAFGFVEALHESLYFGRMPSIKVVGVSLLSLILAAAIGVFVYKKAEPLVRDEL